MKAELITLGVAAVIGTALALRSRMGDDLPFSFDPGKAQQDLRRNIGRGEYRLPIVGGEKGLRFAPFLADPKNYTAVSGGHVVFPKDGAPGDVVAYAEAYWGSYLSVLREKNLLHVYEAKVEKAAAFAKQEANPAAPGGPGAP